MNIKLYTSRNCPVCEMVKAKLKGCGYEFETKSAADDYDEMAAELAVRGIEAAKVRTAPVMVIEGCEIVWTGHDGLIAIDEKEWEA